MVLSIKLDIYSSEGDIQSRNRYRSPNLIKFHHNQFSKNATVKPSTNKHWNQLSIAPVKSTVSPTRTDRRSKQTFSSTPTCQLKLKMTITTMTSNIQLASLLPLLLLLAGSCSQPLFCAERRGCWIYMNTQLRFDCCFKILYVVTLTLGLVDCTFYTGSLKKHFGKLFSQNWLAFKL